MHEVLVNRLGGLSLPRKSVVRLTDRPDLTLDVYRGRKTTMQQQQNLIYLSIYFGEARYYQGKLFQLKGENKSVVDKIGVEAVVLHGLYILTCTLGRHFLTPQVPETQIAEFANSADLDEVPHNEQPHLDLHCLSSSL